MFLINFYEETKCVRVCACIQRKSIRKRFYHKLTEHSRLVASIIVSCFDFHVLSLESHSFSDILYVTSINITINPQSVDAKIEILRGNFAFFESYAFSVAPEAKWENRQIAVAIRRISLINSYNCVSFSKDKVLIQCYMLFETISRERWFLDFIKKLVDVDISCKFRKFRRNFRGKYVTDDVRERKMDRGEAGAKKKWIFERWAEAEFEHAQQRRSEGFRGRVIGSTR